MEPLPLKTRRFYAVVSFVLFVGALVLATFYASGYRFDEWSLAATGAIYVSVPVSEAVITLNGEEVGKSGLLSKSFFIDTLAPGSYVLQASLDGYYPWAKTLVVVPKLVTDASAFLVPQTLLTEPASSTPALALAFATSTSEEPSGGLELVLERGNVYLRSARPLEGAPSAFCIAPGSCAIAIPVETGAGTVTHAEFFNNGVVYAIKESGVFLAEADIRSPQTVIPLYPKMNADFRIIRGSLFIKDGPAYYEISGW